MKTANCRRSGLEETMSFAELLQNSRKVLAPAGLLNAPLSPRAPSHGAERGMQHRSDALQRRPTDTGASSRELSSVLPPCE